MSIKARIYIGLILVFACLLGGINIMLSQNIAHSSEEYIARDLAAVEANGQFYVNQTLMVNNESYDQAGFVRVAQPVVMAVAGTGGGEYAAYDLGGNLLYAGNESNFLYLGNEDLQLALEGKSAYHADTRQGQTSVTFSFPVFADGQAVGVLRRIADYTLLYGQGESNRNAINLITLLGFGVCLMLAAILSHSITSPIRRLSTNLVAATRGIAEGHLEPERMKEKLNLRRRDEVGLLARNIVRIINRIGRQMETINRDREELLRLSEYRRDFYNSVTHELKTPLTSIKGYSEVIRDNGFTDEIFFRQAIGRVIQESDRLHRMVVTLLENAGVNAQVSLPEEPVDMAALVEEVCLAMQFKAQKFGSVMVLNLRPLRVVGSAQELRQLLINLLDNAIKYAVGDRRITVTLGGDERQALLEITNPANPIPPREMERLFLPYYRGRGHRRREKGSRGIGLGICKHIVEKHGGNIRMQGDNRGTVTVTVALPGLEAEEGVLAQ